MRALILILALSSPALAGGWGFPMDARYHDDLRSSYRGSQYCKEFTEPGGRDYGWRIPWVCMDGADPDTRPVQRICMLGAAMVPCPERRGDLRPIILAQGSWCAGNCGPIPPDVARWMYDNDPERKRERALAEQRERDRGRRR